MHDVEWERIYIYRYVINNTIESKIFPHYLLICDIRYVFTFCFFNFIRFICSILLFLLFYAAVLFVYRKKNKILE